MRYQSRLAGWLSRISSPKFPGRISPHSPYARGPKKSTVPCTSTSCPYRAISTILSLLASCLPAMIPRTALRSANKVSYPINHSSSFAPISKDGRGYRIWITVMLTTRSVSCRCYPTYLSHLIQYHRTSFVHSFIHHHVESQS